MGSRSSQPRWIIFKAIARALLTASVLVALYYLLPLSNDVSEASTVLKLAVGLIVFSALMIWQVRSITEADNPGLKALESLCLAVPLFLLLYSSTYYVMSFADRTNFTSHLSKTDALYFTVTTFSTVGFGDITATTEAARLVVISQIMLDLVILGFGLRTIVSAVERGREKVSQRSAPNLES
jgi:voltage-gated potassium channel